MKDQKKWNSWVEKNKDPYGKQCIDVAREAMRILDKDPTPLDHALAGELISIADRNLDAGITAFMAGSVAVVISQCHERGEEFRLAWNGKNKTDGVTNPALITINPKK